MLENTSMGDIVSVFRHKWIKILFLLLAMVTLMAGLLTKLLIPDYRNVIHPRKVGGPFGVSPDGKRLGLNVEWSNNVRQFCVIELNEQSMLSPVPEVELASGVTWHPRASPPEILAVTTQLDKGNKQEMQRIIVAAQSKNKFTVLSDNALILSPDISVILPQWNPAGTILAMVVTKRTFNEIDFHLGISYDSGKSIRITDVSIARKEPVWLDNNTICVQQKNQRFEDEIWEVKVAENEVKLTNRLYSGYGLFLCGSTEGEPVYLLGQTIYCGKNMLYCSSRNMSYLLVSGRYIAFREFDSKGNNDIVVLDKHGREIAKKPLKDNERIAGVSDVVNCAYIVIGKRFVERWCFLSNETPTVFELTMIRSSEPNTFDVELLDKGASTFEGFLR